MGTGHVMRCIALAQAAVQRGMQVVFHTYCPVTALVERLKAERFQLVEHSGFCRPDDFAESLGLTPATRIDRSYVILDGYHFDEAHHAAVRSAGVPLVIIDDYNHLPHYTCNILLNPSIGSKSLQYRTGAVQLVGPEFAILRKEFYAQHVFPRRYPDSPKNLLLTMGGADPDNTTSKCITLLRQIPVQDMHVTILLGPANRFAEQISMEAKTLGHAHTIRHAAKDMPQLMQENDVAISAAGSTCLELAYMGVPVMVTSLAENQIGIAKGIEDLGIGINLGHHASLGGKQAVDSIWSFLSNPARLAEASHRATNLVTAASADTFFRHIEATP